MKKQFFTSSIVFMLFLTTLCSSNLFAKDYKASLAQMPCYAESMEKGVLVDFTKALAEVSNGKITYQVVPFNRSMYAVENKQVDFHMPLIKLPDSKKAEIAKLNYDYSTETIFHVNFTLYSNKKKPLDMKNLKAYKIETDNAHTPYFDFPITGVTNLEASIRKVDAGQIDGLIFADAAIDNIIKSQGIKNIKRELYHRFDVKIILPKGGQGGETDKMLSEVIGKLKKSGKFNTIMGGIDAPYDNWQP